LLNDQGNVCVLCRTPGHSFSACEDLDIKAVEETFDEKKAQGVYKSKLGESGLHKRKRQESQDAADVVMTGGTQA
jgi:hypothetical protein